MVEKTRSLVCFSSIELGEPIIDKNKVRSKITLNFFNKKSINFTLIHSYQNNIKEDHLPILRLANIMPLLNYGLFSEEFFFDFPLSSYDLKIINELNNIFSRDIFVNKILRRRTNYIISKYIPSEENVSIDMAQPKAKIKVLDEISDNKLGIDIDFNRFGILSSGGKESLLTYGLLKELGGKVYPLYVNESGGHWRTALSAYRYHVKNDKNTQRVWTNVDRFYLFMLDNLDFIRSNHRKIQADTYPVRLCIFPFYVFLLLPIFIDNQIGNLLIGSEFDDLRSKPEYLGIPHYYGIYDQHQDYDILMNSWFEKRTSGIVQWSAVRNISGLIVERILVDRYPNLARYQRSCHSCHFENNNIVPCGKCSKCMGVLLFLLANGSDPKIMAFRKEDINSFHNRVKTSNLRLDQDEKNQSFYLIGAKGNIPKVKSVEHVEKIHINCETCDISYIPNYIRDELLKILVNILQVFVF